MKKTPDSNRLLIFQIALSIVLALMLLIVNYEEKQPEYEKQKLVVMGLKIQKLDYQNDSLALQKRPMKKKMKKN